MRILPTRRSAFQSIAAVATALLFAGCGNSPATATPATSAISSTPPATAAPSQAPSAPASAPAPTGSSVPSFAIPSFSTDKELEGMLPGTFQGVTLNKLSFSGSVLAGGGTASSAEFLALLQTLGKNPEDLTFALASDPARQLVVTFAAYRIKGVDAATWAPMLYQIGEKETPGTASTDASLGGKNVKRVVTPASTDITYAYPRGDTLFLVIAPDDAHAADAIAAMP